MRNYVRFSPFDDEFGPESDKSHRQKYSHRKSYDQGRGNSVRPVSFPDDDEGGDWDQSEIAEAGVSYRKPL